ncbi:MAG: GIY-YIG nuclease family protein [Firmicutes bacterium]|nr:GIY-YIG nuclease family protein [Bacillota bacterium]
MEFIIAGIIICLILIIAVVYALKRKKKPAPDKTVELKADDVQELVNYVKIQKEQQQQEQRQKELKKAELKEKTEKFKQSREQIKDRLKSKIDAREWKPLRSILDSADKGGVGIYILYNQTKDKYYVGQAKQLYKRIRDHFKIEGIAMDFLSGDNITVKTLTANELDSDYRLDHIEKTGIEIFNSDKDGYNKNTGIM